MTCTNKNGHCSHIKERTQAFCCYCGKVFPEIAEEWKSQLRLEDIKPPEEALK